MADPRRDMHENKKSPTKAKKKASRKKQAPHAELPVAIAFYVPVGWSTVIQQICHQEQKTRRQFIDEALTSAVARAFADNKLSLARPSPALKPYSVRMIDTMAPEDRMLVSTEIAPQLYAALRAQAQKEFLPRREIIRRALYQHVITALGAK